MYTPLDAAYAELEEGVDDYASASIFTRLSRTELERAVAAGEIETFHHNRRLLMPRRAVRLWLAKKLLAERQARKS